MFPRPGRNYRPETFEDALNEDHFKFEAAYMYTVGNVQTGLNACMNCQGGNGPFLLCSI